MEVMCIAPALQESSCLVGVPLQCLICLDFLTLEPGWSTFVAENDGDYLRLIMVLSNQWTDLSCSSPRGEVDSSLPVY